MEVKEIVRSGIVLKRVDGEGSEGSSRMVEGTIPIGEVQDLRDSEGIMETFEAGAFKEADVSDVDLTLNHREVLATTRSGLEVSYDDENLYFRGEIAETTAGNDTLVSLKRGDIRGASFALRVGVEEVQKNDDGDDVIVYKKIALLRDVALVHHPAYTGTTVVQRMEALKSFRQKEAETKADMGKKECKRESRFFHLVQRQRI